MTRLQRLTERVAGKLLGPAAGDRVRRFFEPPRFDGFIRVYPTLACNLHCNYCVNYHHPPAFRGEDYPLLSPQQWSEALNRIGRHVILTGGEPFLYPGILDLLNRLDRRLIVKIYTNFAAPETVAIMKGVARPVIFFGSYHPGSGPPERFLHTVNLIKEMGKFQGSLHAIATAKQKNFLHRVQQQFAAAGWNLILDVDQFELFPGASLKFRQPVTCTRRLILVAPDGNRFQCVSRLVRREMPLENILEQDPEPERVTVACDDYGYCAPCDGLGETRIRPR